jgi:GAF domain-containing protein
VTEPESGPDSGDEIARLRAVEACGVMDTPREMSFDSIVFTAAQLFRVPMAILAIVGQDRVWLKSCVGPLSREWAREGSFCALVVDRNQMLVVEDALLDSRYAQTPMVGNAPNVRFYAGIPILGPGNQPIGALSVLDRLPRTVPERARTQLKQLAREAEQLLKRRAPTIY